MPHKATVKLLGLSTYSQSRFHATPKLNKELADAYEERTWREKMHRDDKGFVIIPAMSFKNAIAETAKFLSIQIPGKGKSTYTKHFESGILVAESPQVLVNGNPIHYENVSERWVHVPSNGVSGAGSRVLKCFPTIPMGWTTTVEYLILDDVITPDVFCEHLEQCGQLIGIGTFRVRNKGTQGRFRVEEVNWQNSVVTSKKVRLIVDGREAA